MYAYNYICMCIRLQGSYEALQSGVLADSLHDFTGGLVESYALDEKVDPEKLSNVLFNSIDHRSLVSCGIDVSFLILVFYSKYL